MTLEPFKYLIQPVAIERDGDRIVGEKTAQVTTVFSAQEAVALIAQFEQEIQRLNEEVSNGDDQHADGDAVGDGLNGADLAARSQQAVGEQRRDAHRGVRG